jgi:hypothetical protein
MRARTPAPTPPLSSNLQLHGASALFRRESTRSEEMSPECSRSDPFPLILSLPSAALLLSLPCSTRTKRFCHAFELYSARAPAAALSTAVEEEILQHAPTAAPSAPAQQSRMLTRTVCAGDAPTE